MIVCSVWCMLSSVVSVSIACGLMCVFGMLVVSVLSHFEWKKLYVTWLQLCWCPVKVEACWNLQTDENDLFGAYIYIYIYHWYLCHSVIYVFMFFLLYLTAPMTSCCVVFCRILFTGAVITCQISHTGLMHTLQRFRSSQKSKIKFWQVTRFDSSNNSTNKWMNNINCGVCILLTFNGSMQ